MGCALAHPEPPPLYHVEGRGLQGDQDQQQPLLGRGPRTGLVGRVPTGRARRPVEAPVGHMGLEHGLKGWDERLTRGPRETGPIQHLRGAGLKIGQPYTAHGCDRLSVEAQHTINRDYLYCMSELIASFENGPHLL